MSILLVAAVVHLNERFGHWCKNIEHQYFSKGREKDFVASRHVGDARCCGELKKTKKKGEVKGKGLGG